MLRAAVDAADVRPDLRIRARAQAISAASTLMVIVYVGFVSGRRPRGLLSLPIDDGQNVRAAMVLTAVWFAMFALPLLISAPAQALAAGRKAHGRVLGGVSPASGRTSASEWRRDRNVVYYLIASAVFRDGLTGVFTFGAVLGVQVYGISAGRCAAVRGGRQRGRRGRRRARRSRSTTGSARSRSSSSRSPR